MKKPLLILSIMLVLTVWWSGWLTKTVEAPKATVIASVKNETSPESVSKEIPPSKISPSIEPPISQKLPIDSMVIVTKPTVTTKNSNEVIRPRSMKDVSISSKLQTAINEYPNYYEKLDYELRFYDKLSSCLEAKTPNLGSITIKLYFIIDENRKKATGSDDFEDSFQVIKSNLNQLDEDQVIFCAKEAHIGQEMDITNGVYPETAKDFYRPTRVDFPISENDIYWFLSHNGEYKNGAKE
jgi:hypothetical protein